jgi:hypothetical protein
MLKWTLETEWIPKGLIVVNLLERYTSIIQSRKKRSKREFRLKAHIEDCEISNFMLDFGSDVNIVPTNTWEAMGKPNIDYSHGQLRMANQYCIYHIVRLQKIEVDISRIKTIIDFEVNGIMGEKDFYPTLLGID